MPQLTEEQFKATFTPPMTDVTASAEEVTEIWPYIESVLATEFSDFDSSSWDVEYIYLNESRSYQHILIKTSIDNAYLVVVLDIPDKCIYGHHFLNLGQKYGLSN